ncbi:monovalent cation/H(+) antiporter subunit G [Alphaproteobacteria bacterium]|nr:monovalent cation/H(+) antiporter subunit G [Alphaproteobacteria bacterium]
MYFILDIISWILILFGIFFSIVGAIGLIRFPDFFSRLHAAGLTDTLGAWCLLSGFVLQSETFITSAKLILIILFIFFTSPTGTHALARAGLASNLKPWVKNTNNSNKEK